MDCVLHMNPSMPSEESEGLVQAFRLAGIGLSAKAPLAVHAIEPFGLVPIPHHPVPGNEPLSWMLRVRRSSPRRSGAIDWAVEVTVDLAAWLLTCPPPSGAVIEATVPSTAAAPRLGRGFVDRHHVWIEAKEGGLSSEIEPVLRTWARATVEAMRPRWSTGPSCPCC
ncbi:MAG TPA: hypothetical protein VLK85_34515 [Ramlibacter sp.]|nr:hypothetical protein [Ramlibacter sp.]